MPPLFFLILCFKHPEKSRCLPQVDVLCGRTKAKRLSAVLPWQHVLCLSTREWTPWGQEQHHTSELPCAQCLIHTRDSVDNWVNNGNLLQYSRLENPMDRGAWWAAVHGVARSRTRLSDFTFTFHFHALEKEMATHSSVLAWRIPGTGEPGGLPSLGSHRVGHDWSDLTAAAAGTQ